MSPREAIHILMLSPIYFRLRPAERWQLVCEYCRRFTPIRHDRWGHPCPCRDDGGRGGLR